MRTTKTKRIQKRTPVRSYPVIVHSDPSGIYWVECVGLEGCYSQGKTIDEALKNIQEAIGLGLLHQLLKDTRTSPDEFLKSL